MNIIKKCKDHGRQSIRYSFCPYCGLELEIEELYRECDLPLLQDSGEKVRDLAQYEARGTAWGEIGLSGVVSFMLANKNINPIELRAFSKDYVIKGIGKKSLEVINGFTEEDLEKFSKTYYKLIQKDSWTWELAKWRYSSEGKNCTNYEYDKMKQKFKKIYLEKNSDGK